MATDCHQNYKSMSGVAKAEEQACRDRVIQTAMGKHQSSWSTVMCKAQKRLEGPAGAEEVEPLKRVSGKSGVNSPGGIHGQGKGDWARP